MENIIQDNHDKITVKAAEAVKLINNAADQAATVIANAAQSASKLLASNAIDANKVLTSNQGHDHDLLVELKVRMEGIREDIKNLSGANEKRIDALEREKLNVSDSYDSLYKPKLEASLQDIDMRVRFIERKVTQITTYGTGLLILLGLIEFLVGKIFKI